MQAIVPELLHLMHESAQSGVLIVLPELGWLFV